MYITTRYFTFISLFYTILHLAPPYYINNTHIGEGVRGRIDNIYHNSHGYAHTRTFLRLILHNFLYFQILQFFTNFTILHIPLLHYTILFKFYNFLQFLCWAFSVFYTLYNSTIYSTIIQSKGVPWTCSHLITLGHDEI